MESTLIGKTTAEFMERLEKGYEDDETAKVVNVMVIVEVDRAFREGEHDECNDPDCEGTMSMFHFRSSDPRWVNERGLVQTVVNMLDSRD